MLWDDLMKVGNKVEASTKIKRSIQLDQQYFKGKQLLKINLNSQDDQLEKVQQKSGVASQGQV